MPEQAPSAMDAATQADPSPVLLSVVVPVFNQAASIVANIRTIRERVVEELDAPVEVLVVSDGSIDDTEAELLAFSDAHEYRVLHYDRNFGKGYAIKLGALESRGAWVGFVDADLDLDPRGLAEFVRIAEAEELDFAIGSKRHPDSAVHYPTVRVAASWLFQQLVRLLFQLDVRDTQVGSKLFRREVVDQVFPLLLVKRYAFDLEMLAVAHAFGFRRIRELPIRLDYRFTGSGVRSRAVARAVVDTLAVFYRLRVLRYYQRRRAIMGPYGWARPRLYRPTVCVVLGPAAHLRERDYERARVVPIPEHSSTAIRRVAEDSTEDVIAVLEPGARSAANWLSSTTPFFARSEIDCVVTPKIAPLGGSVRARAAAAVAESRFGGLVYFRYTPGNVRYVDDFPSASFLARRDRLLELAPGTTVETVPAALAAAGGRVLYTPESVIVADPPALFRPHLAVALRHGRDRGRAFRQRRVPSLRPVVVLVALVGLALALGLWGSGRVSLLAGLFIAYATAVAAVAAISAVRFHSPAVGALTAAGAVATHLAYLVGLVSGAVTG